MEGGSQILHIGDIQMDILSDDNDADIILNSDYDDSDHDK